MQDEIPFEVVLDSGAAEHVTDSAEAPGYQIEPSAGSKAGMGFVAANGARIPNKGQMTLSLKTEGNQKINSTFQVCSTNKPLWSVGKICDSGCEVKFSSDKAVVRRLGVVNRSGADAPHRESKPSAHAPAPHDTTDQWRDPVWWLG